MKVDSFATRFLRVAMAQANLHLPKGVLFAEVSLTINGEELPFEQVMAQWSAEVDVFVNTRAEELAVDLVTDAGLGDVLHRLNAARMDVMRAFVTLRERCPDDVPKAAQV